MARMNCARMRDRGAVTFAQNAETSVIFGMPGEAIRLGAAAHVLSPSASPPPSPPPSTPPPLPHEPRPRR